MLNLCLLGGGGVLQYYSSVNIQKVVETHVFPGNIVCKWLMLFDFLHLC